MSANDSLLQSHHVIEQSNFLRNPLLRKLAEHGLIDADVSVNRLYLPKGGQLADTLETSPHRGRTRSSYTKELIAHLEDIFDSPDGKAAMRNAPAALQRVAGQVRELQDTLKVALINGDVFTTIPDRLTKADTNAQNHKTFSDLDSYRATHADQLKALRSMSAVESEWAAITHSEQRIAKVIETARATGRTLVAVPDERDAVIREIAGREELRMAIAHAESAGRVRLSDSTAALVSEVLDDTPTAVGDAPLRIAHAAGSTPHLYTPLSQRGFTTVELLTGELSTGQALRTAGLLATAADTVMTGQRATHLLGQDNPLAAQSELAHFTGRNVGGWAGGSAAAYALGSSGAGPMVLIAADAYFMSVASEKAAALLDNRAIYRQTDHDGTPWSFNGTAWTRDGLADTSQDGVDNPIATPIVDRQPSNASDHPSLRSAEWIRDDSNGQWHRLVKTDISGANDRGSYVQETASPPRAAELDTQAQATIARNTANSPGAIAARYELAHYRNGWAAESWPLAPAVQQMLPDPDALTASDGRRYYRDSQGQWTSHGAPPDGNRLLQLETKHQRQARPDLELLNALALQFRSIAEKHAETLWSCAHE
ncbi:AHH domain-containing protein [Xanthomonas cucurbitae]|nr:hypothetical protein EBN15_08050 [Xanthomonas cucurbitae]WDM76872.1 AHH domain-containing protein [Xanthomonas cucurbitae]